MKHVLALSTIYPNPANARFGTFVARSMEALARRGAKRGDWKVSVVNPIGLPPLGLGALSDRYRALADLPGRSEENGVTVHRPRFTLIPKVGARRNVSAIAKACRETVRTIHADEPVDVLDAQFFFPDGPAVAALAGELALPFTIKARGSDIHYWGGVSHAREAMVEAAAGASGLLSVSAKLKEAMVALGMPDTKIRVHYTGLDRDLFRPLGHTQLRAQLGETLGFALPTGAPLLACVGALNGRKGHDIAIEALGLLSDEYPEARLLLVGKGEEAASLATLAQERGLAERVNQTGAVDHNVLPVILSASDVMVLPTQNEGLANAWVEALACGTPVVTTDVGGARELVTSDVAGRLVERDPQSVASALRTILAQPPAPEAVAANAARFDWVTHAEKLARYYEELAG